MIEVQQFVFNPFQENTYLVWNENGACAIIDPGCLNDREERQLISAIEDKNLKPVLLLNTHCHIDHVFGNAFVHEKYGLRPHIHSMEQPVLEAVPQVAQMYGLPYRPSPDPVFYDDEIKLGDEIFEVLFVPGHSPGHVALHNSRNNVLLSGDVLFKQSIGRTDLPGGDMDTLMNSIKSKLISLPDETVVYSGHMGETTIGDEKINNPFLKGIYQG